ncbi:MFS transporter [Comamonas aquatica]|uniref:MFS transporter n=1 Tax=Comamonas aquatica TaxID=225991 RepID=UPI002448244D|nr:MFS transporter [Comamonas aquatica]MDH0383520.1 MFS transporter [Comamonas aquatica]MDH0431508.1 MFS transporter [Comamonas aquatica]MDH0942599.1 MFS transporter [Comamonas aquatica]
MHTPPHPSTPTGGWYFGWNIVAAATLLTLLTVGMRLGIGPLFLPMADDLGFSRSLLAGIIAIGMLCYGLAMPVAGWLVARVGTRHVLLLGTAILVLSTLWAVNTRSAQGIFWSFGVCMSVGAGFTSPVALTPVISRWFQRRRGMALFFLSTGSMAGIAVMTPALGWALQHFSWQHTLLGFAAVFTLITVPTALWVVRDAAPEGGDAPLGSATGGTAARPAPGAQLSVLQAMRTTPFLKVTLGLFACGFSMNLMGTHCMPMLLDHGFDATTSALGIGLIGLVAIPSTMVLGRLADRVERRKMLSVIYGVRGLGFLGLMLVGSAWQLYGVAAVGGVVWAGSIALSSAILADVYGVKKVGMLYGWAYLGHQVGAMISAWLGGWGFEQHGTHWLAFGAAAALLALAAGVALRLPGHDRPAVFGPAQAA